jgi:hypothetical protein
MDLPTGGGMGLAAVKISRRRPHMSERHNVGYSHSRITATVLHNAARLRSQVVAIGDSS